VSILLRFLAAVIGAILGAVVAFVVDLVIGDGVRLIPISEFLLPILVGAALGFCLGFVFYKFMGRFFGFLDRFSVEVPS
jgi:uncharacterized membrane protein